MRTSTCDDEASEMETLHTQGTGVWHEDPRLIPVMDRMQEVIPYMIEKQSNDAQRHNSLVGLERTQALRQLTAM